MGLCKGVPRNAATRSDPLVGNASDGNVIAMASLIGILSSFSLLARYRGRHFILLSTENNKEEGEDGQEASRYSNMPGLAWNHPNSMLRRSEHDRPGIKYK